jgi:hypothetical protein
MSYTPPPPPPEEGDRGQQQPPPGYGVPGYGPPGAGYGPAKTNTKAMISLILGIVSLPFGLCCSIFGLVGIAAIILGNSAKKEIAASGGAETGEGMAKAGLILGIIGTVLAVIMTVVSIVLVASGNNTFDFRTY